MFLISIQNLAQVQPDSSLLLNEVVIKSYAAGSPVYKVPAAIGLLEARDFTRFSNVAITSAVNTLPGVRMEERSPGSYRLAIRGSSLRSPFGVRNVKIYWNQLPLTDPGGNTYLNQLDAGTIHQMEIIKGPGSSLYGAGTGGVVLLESLFPHQERSVSLSQLIGSFGLNTTQFSLRDGHDQSNHHVQYLHQQSDGYREQTRMVRDAVNSTFQFNLNDGQVLEAILFYTDLYYQTPGGLTLPEMEANPRQARPAAGIFPGAVGQNAGVSLRSFYSGVSHEYQFSKSLHNRTGVYGNLVQFQNPAIRNFERRTEQSFGARSVTDFSITREAVKVTVLGGGEFQYGFSPIKTYQNLQGSPGALQSDDEIRIVTYSVFGQAELSFQNWLMTGGLSLNGLSYQLTELNASFNESDHRYTPVFTPRMAVSRKVTEQLWAYGNLSFGFSPPTLAEVRPSTGEFNTDLKPEKGTQLEIGAKGFLNKRQLQLDIAAYIFRLNETIVVRRDADGADYFVNAGSTRQQGAEVSLAWTPIISTSSVFSKLKLWTSATLNDFTFDDYSKNNIEYSGNRLTGTPRQMLNAGADVDFKNRVGMRFTVHHTGNIPLDDANSVFADSYTLLGARLQYQATIHKNLSMDIFLGIDNALDESYSLGNDLNAAAGRYFNPAAGRNYYGGVHIKIGR